MNLPRRSLLSGVSLFAGVGAVSATTKTLKINDLQTEIDKAIEGGGVLRLPVGTFATVGLKVERPLHIEGIAGQTKLISLSGGPVLEIKDTESVTIRGVHFGGRDVPPTDELSRGALVVASHIRGLVIESCQFSGSPFSGLNLDGCSGRIVGNQFSKLGITGLFALDSNGLEISSNEITDIGNNGIQVWRSKSGEDGTQILNNRISHVRFDAGGDGQNGNAIMVYRAGSVIAAHNRVSDLAYTGVRFNSSSNGQIIGNSISRTGEKAIYAEFSFEGMVISNNVVEDVAFGISITNFDVGGRMAVCTGNLVRKVRRGKTATADVAWGISADADTLVSNNIVEDVDDAGINLGWSGLCRNLVAQGNIVRNCDRGIALSVTQGAGKIMVSGNMIDGARLAAIQGMDYFNAKTDDLAVLGSVAPAHVTLNNNIAFKS